MNNVIKAIKAQQYYAEKFAMKEFTPKGDFDLINWLYKHGQGGLPVTSENRYMFRSSDHVGTQALALRLVIGVGLPCTIITQGSKDFINRLAGRMGFNTHPEVSSWDETLGHYGFPVEFDDQHVKLSAQVYTKLVGKGIRLPFPPTNNTWWILNKPYLDRFKSPISEQLFFKDDCYLSPDYLDINWEIILENSQDSYKSIGD